MAHSTLLLFTFLLIAISAAPGAYAFGAGEIPDYAYLADKAFRHGDLEQTLSEMYKIVGSHGSHFGGGLLAGVASVLAGGRGKKFSGMDIKRVYFGNWICDYSQAMDIAGLSKLTANALVTIVMALSFMTFGFATAEFELTADRLGVYLPVVHIDNPKGYGEKEGDPRQFHPKLRPPVNPEELEIDEQNGMKKYIATEGQSWDTSTAHLRRIFTECIERGRRAGGNDGDDLYEAFRLLGTGLHTLEDLLAHSNWCELSLRKLGHEDVFCHVGDNVLVETPNGSAPPLITGTFGSADFIHSLLGEATDHLSEASLTDLTKKLGDAKNQDQSDSPISKITSILSKLPSSGGDDKMAQGEEIKAKALDFNPDDVAPEEVQRQLWEILLWRDGVMKDISRTIESIPGLEDLVDQLTQALNVYVFTMLEPFMTPILQQATGTLQEGSAAVIDANHEDQYQVFTDPDASDPSHSLLSKDHFALILNEPAGKVAIVVVKASVTAIVEAWYSDDDVDRVIDKVLEAFHHPYHATGSSEIQNEMADELRRWFEGMSEEDQGIVLNNLTKQSVRDGKNKRVGHEDADTAQCSHGTPPRVSSGGGYQSQSQRRQQQYYGGRQQNDSYGGAETRQETSYGSSREHDSSERTEYGGRRQQGYGGGGGYGQSEEPSNEYGSGRSHHRQQDGETSYGSYGERQTQEESYGSSRRSEEPSNEYGSGRSYHRQTEEDVSYGRRHNDYEGSEARQEQSYGGAYGRQDESASGYGHHTRRGDEDETPAYGGRREENEYGNGGFRRQAQPEEYGGSRRNEEETPSYGGRQEYSSHQDQAESYGDGYGQQEETPNEYGGGRRSHHHNEEESYGGQSQRRSRNEDEGYDNTYGAERLNINEDEERPSRYESEY